MCFIYFAYAISKWNTISKDCFLFLLSGAAAVSVLGIVIVLLTCMYVSLSRHKLDFIIEVSNLMSALASQFPRDLSFMSTRFLVLN